MRVLAALLVSAPLAAAAGDPFSDGTGRMPGEGRLEIGVFSPLRWAVRDRVELSVHPVAFFVAPHVDVKLGWGEPGGVALASVHGLSYPTPLMRLLSREGAGGILPADVTFPQVLSTSHHLYASVPLGSHLLTGRLGGRLAWNLTEFDGPRFWSQVEWHFAWPRTAAWYTGWSVDGGLSAQGPVAGRFRYRADADLFLMPGLDGDRAVEGRLLLEWRPSPRFRLQAGAAFSWAVFPYGERFLWPPFPVVDAAWGWDLGPRKPGSTLGSRGRPQAVRRRAPPGRIRAVAHRRRPTGGTACSTPSPDSATASPAGLGTPSPPTPACPPRRAGWTWRERVAGSTRSRPSRAIATFSSSGSTARPTR